ncbi:hypothetical protein [Nonomuraea jabiensis]|uniref:hypothetical protein n=1 Tax=Nonomuraea jabiensis TaxID=882448 RepID=UPI003D733AB6
MRGHRPAARRAVIDQGLAGGDVRLLTLLRGLMIVLGMEQRSLVGASASGSYAMGSDVRVAGGAWQLEGVVFQRAVMNDEFYDQVRPDC